MENSWHFSGGWSATVFKAMCWFEALTFEIVSWKRLNAMNTTNSLGEGKKLCKFWKYLSLFMECTKIQSNFVSCLFNFRSFVCTNSLCVETEKSRFCETDTELSSLERMLIAKIKFVEWTLTQQEKNTKKNISNRFFSLERTECFCIIELCILSEIWERTLRAECETHWPRRHVWIGSANMHFEDLLVICVRQSPSHSIEWEGLSTGLWVNSTQGMKVAPIPSTRSAHLRAGTSFHQSGLKVAGKFHKFVPNLIHFLWLGWLNERIKLGQFKKEPGTFMKMHSRSDLSLLVNSCFCWAIACKYYRRHDVNWQICFVSFSLKKYLLKDLASRQHHLNVVLGRNDTDTWCVPSTKPKMLQNVS